MANASTAHRYPYFRPRCHRSQQRCLGSAWVFAKVHWRWCLFPR
jgi:hypothetical protein